MAINITKIKKSEAKITFAEMKRAADTQIVSDQPYTVEDEFTSMYEASKGGVVLIAPPFMPLQLIALCTRNNTLQQAIHAMEVNIDGTGHDLELIEGETEDGAQKKKAENFFKEPFPGMSMVTLRRKLRVDTEQVGYGYMEVVRNIEGEMVFLRYVRSAGVRMVKLDDAVEAEKKVMRDDQEFTAKMWVRERRYCQMIGTQVLYFKEYGASRDVHKKLGTWHKIGELKPEDKGGELLRFVVDDDATTPYGIPRWINNMPSVIGSRKAEEFNLDFFDSGGMPPAIIFIQGGALTTTVRDQLMAHLAGTGSKKHRAAVVEVQSSGGTLDSSSKVDVRTERFGTAKTNDAMFQVYDEKCEARVRGAFRLPKLFFGRSESVNFATAVVDYMVAEAQVFQSERGEFDEVINSTIMHELGITKYKFKSKPITLKDVTTMMQAMALVPDKVKGEDFINALNDITGLSLKFDQATADKAAEAAKPQMGLPKLGPDGKPIPPPASVGKPVASSKPEPDLSTDQPVNPRLSMKKGEWGAEDIVDLVDDWLLAVGITKGEMPVPVRTSIIMDVKDLNQAERAMFNKVLASKSVNNRAMDAHGVDEIAGGCVSCMTH